MSHNATTVRIDQQRSSADRLDAPPGLAADDFGAERLRWRVKDQFDFSEFAA